MVSLFKSDLNSVCIFLMIEKALSEVLKEHQIFLFQKKCHQVSPFPPKTVQYYSSKNCLAVTNKDIDFDFLWTISSCIWFCDFACLVRSFFAPDPIDKCDLQRMQYASFTLRSLWLSQLNSASQAFWYLHKYFFRLAGEEQAGPSSSSFGIPDKDLFLPVDILQKWFNFFIVKTTQTFHKGINFILKDPIIANYLPWRYIVVDCSCPFGLLPFR